MMTIKHTEAFDLAYRFVTETNLNIFLTGKAGTGKTTFLKYLRENSFKKMVVAAPTGVAAINAGGVTLHSLFQLPFAPYIPSKDVTADAVNSHSLLSQIRYNKEKLEIFRNLELLVIDEASMVASHTVDAIDAILRSVRRRNQLPFGGVQVLFIGDLHQLPPVVKNMEWQFLKHYYPSIFFFDSLVLQEHVPVMVELKEIFRQQDNSFINILNEIRHNELTEDSFELLNARLKPNFVPADDEGYITLTTHNSQADEINKAKLRRLPGIPLMYRAEIKGLYPEHLYPAEPNLELKVGAQVMFLRNDIESKAYFNGKIGVITKLTSDTVKVKCKGEDFSIEVRKQEWKNVNYSLTPGTREITEEELGSFTQYPLRLAWAITIHKSQGLTFNKLIIDAENAFANGQVYVALSRCTSLEGLVLTSHINRRFLGAHQNLTQWQERNQDDKHLKNRFDDSRQNYIQQELQSIFTWKNWFFELKDLNDILNENKDYLPQYSTWISELIEKQKTIQFVADKFKEQIVALINENGVVEENEALQKRVKEASAYFTTEIGKWRVLFAGHPLTADVKKVARKIDDAIDDLNFVVHEILHKISYCRNGFILNDYLKSGKKPGTVASAIQSCYGQSNSNIVMSDDIKHIELYDRIADMRRELGGKTNLPLYTIFSNKAIQNVCNDLPGTKEALLNVNGFGKAKVQKYGDEVLEIVSKYCSEHNLATQLVLKAGKRERKENKTPTVEETIRYFKEGNTIEEIAKERNLVVGTIEGHFADAIKEDLVQIEELMSMEEVNKIATYFPSNPSYMLLSAVKEIVPKDISYGKLKMVLAWIQKKK